MMVLIAKRWKIVVADSGGGGDDSECRQHGMHTADVVVVRGRGHGGRRLCCRSGSSV